MTNDVKNDIISCFKCYFMFIVKVIYGIKNIIEFVYNIFELLFKLMKIMIGVLMLYLILQIKSFVFASTITKCDNCNKFELKTTTAKVCTKTHKFVIDRLWNKIQMEEKCGWRFVLDNKGKKTPLLNKNGKPIKDSTGNIKYKKEKINCFDIPNDYLLFSYSFERINKRGNVIKDPNTICTGLTYIHTERITKDNYKDAYKYKRPVYNNEVFTKSACKYVFEDVINYYYYTLRDKLGDKVFHQLELQELEAIISFYYHKGKIDNSMINHLKANVKMKSMVSNKYIFNDLINDFLMKKDKGDKKKWDGTDIEKAIDNRNMNDLKWFIYGTNTLTMEQEQELSLMLKNA